MTDASQLNVQEKHSGDTPLIAACRSGKVKVVEYLLENGADVHLTNQVEQQAIDLGGLCEVWSEFECLSVLVSETEDMSSLCRQEDILATRLPDGRYSDAHPTAWLLRHGNKPGQGSADLLTNGPRWVVKFDGWGEAEGWGNPKLLNWMLISLTLFSLVGQQWT